MWIFLLFLPLALAQKPDCSKVEINFNLGMANNPVNCERSADCAVKNYHYDPCVPVAVRKDFEIQDFQKHRSEVHKLCGYVPKPCAAPIDSVYCVQKKCLLGQHLRSKFEQVTFYLPHFQSAKFEMTKDTGIRCASAPCPSRETFQAGEIKNYRFTVSMAELLNNRGHDGLALVINGKTFVSLNFDWIAGQLPNEIKLETKPVD